MFPDKLQLEHVSGRNWKVIIDFRYQWTRKDRLITVPAGYITDQASIPKFVLPAIVNDTGDISMAAVPHDFGYTSLNDTWTKTDVDLMFRDAMIEAGMPKWRAYIAWLGVRSNIGKSLSWNKK